MRSFRLWDHQIADRSAHERRLNACPIIESERRASARVDRCHQRNASVIFRPAPARRRVWSCTVLFGLIAVVLSSAATSAADLVIPPLNGRFLATCENLGQFCYADACGRDQIDAAAGCRAQCPSSVVISVVPSACLLARPPAGIVLRRRG